MWGTRRLRREKERKDEGRNTEEWKREKSGEISSEEKGKEVCKIGRIKGWEQKHERRGKGSLIGTERKSSKDLTEKDETEWSGAKSAEGGAEEKLMEGEQK